MYELIKTTIFQLFSLGSEDFIPFLLIVLIVINLIRR